MARVGAKTNDLHGDQQSGTLIEMSSNGGGSCLARVEDNRLELESAGFKNFLLDAMLFVVDLDPFEAYKDSHSRGRLLAALKCSELTGQLQLERDERDRKRTRFHRYMRVFYWYVFVKFQLVGIVHILLLAHQIHHSDESKWRPPVGWKLLHSLEQLTGNPLALLDDIALFLYNGAAGLLLLRFVLIPRYYHCDSHKFDFASIRFLVRPSIEICRFELLAECKLSELEQSIYHSVNNQLATRSESTLDQSPNCDSQPGGSRLPRPVLQSLVDLKEGLRDCWFRMRNQLRSFSEDQGELRAQVLELAWHQTLKSQGRKALILMLCLFGFWGSAVGCVIIGNAVRAHECALASLQWARSSYWSGLGPAVPCRLFTRMDMIFAVEVVLVSCLLLLAEVAHTFLLGVSVFNHLKRIQSMREDLESLSIVLLYDHEIFDRFRRDPGATTRYLDPATRNRLILRMVARLQVFQVDLGDGFREITELAGVFAYHILISPLLMIVKRNVQTQKSKYLSNILLLATLAWINLIGVLCSYITARFLELLKVCWVVEGRLTMIESAEVRQAPASNSDTRRSATFQAPIRLRANQRERSKSGVPEGPLSLTRSPLASPGHATAGMHPAGVHILRGLFQKFLLAFSANTSDFCVHPLGIQLTYRRLVEFNFLALLVLTTTTSSHLGYRPH